MDAATQPPPIVTSEAKMLSSHALNYCADGAKA